MFFPGARSLRVSTPHSTARALGVAFVAAVAAGAVHASPTGLEAGPDAYREGLNAPQVELELDYADEASDRDQWWNRVSALEDLPREHHAGVDAVLENRFGEWMVARFLESGDSATPVRLLGSIAEANLEHLYHTDAQGAIELDSAGKPRMRTTDGLVEDRAAWRARAGAALDAAVEQWLLQFETRTGAFLARLEQLSGDRELSDPTLSSVASSLERAGESRQRGYRRELESIMRLEEQRFLSKRTRDQWSLRRSSETQTASRISSELIAESEERLAAGLERLEAALDPQSSPEPEELTVDPEQWRESFREQFDSGLRLWDKAEERLVAERVDWERQAGVDLEEGERVWAEAYRDLRGARAEWEDGLRAIVEQGELRWENEHEALEVNIAEARSEMEHAISERKSAAQERIHNLAEMYTAARDTLRTSLDSAGYWIGQLQYANDSSDAIGERSEVSRLLAGETEGVYTRISETIEGRYIDPARETLSEAQQASEEWIEENSEYPWWTYDLPGAPERPTPPQELTDSVDAAREDLSRREASVAFVESLIFDGFGVAEYEQWAVFDSHTVVGVNTESMSEAMAAWDEELSGSLVEEIFADTFASFHNPRSVSQLLFWSDTWTRYEAQAEHAFADLMGTYGVALTDEPFGPDDGSVDFDELFADGRWETLYLDDYQIALLEARASERYWSQQHSIAESVYDYASDTSSDRPTEADTQEALDSAQRALEEAQGSYKAAVADLERAGAEITDDRETVSSLVARVEGEQERLSAAREEYRTVMDLHLGQNYEFYQRRVAGYFEDLAAIWGLDAAGEGGEEWQALGAFREASAVHEAESLYETAWSDIADLTQEISGYEYEPWSFREAPEDLEASLEGFDERTSETLRKLHRRWREAREGDPAHARVLRMEMRAVAGRADAFATSRAREREQRLALLTAPNIAVWFERSGVSEQTLRVHGIQPGGIGDYQDLIETISEAKRREEAEWLIRRAAREREAIEHVLAIASDTDRALSASRFLAELDSRADASSDRGERARELAAILWFSRSGYERSHELESEQRLRLESADTALGEIIEALESLEAIDSLEEDTIAETVRPIVEREEYASRFFTGSSVFVGNYDDVSRSVAEDDRRELADLQALRTAVEHHRDGAPAVAALRSETSLESLTGAIAEARLLRGLNEHGGIELVSPDRVSAVLSTMSLSEVSRWRSETARAFSSAAPGLDETMRAELSLWLDEAVSLTIAERATSASSTEYAAEAETVAGKVESLSEQLANVESTRSTIADERRSARSRLVDAVKLWRGDSARVEQFDEAVSLLASSVATSTASQLSHRYGEDFPDPESLYNAALEEVERLLTGMGGESLIDSYSRRFAERAVNRLELARLRFIDANEIEWQSLGALERRFATLSLWEAVPPEAVLESFASVERGAVTLIEEFVSHASLSSDDPAPAPEHFEAWTAARFFDGSAARADVFASLDWLEAAALDNGVQSVELARNSVATQPFDQSDFAGYADALRFVAEQVGWFESMLDDPNERDDPDGALELPFETEYRANAAKHFGVDALETRSVAAFVDSLWVELIAAVDEGSRSFSATDGEIVGALAPEISSILSAPQAGEMTVEGFGELAELDLLEALSRELDSLGESRLASIDTAAVVEEVFSDAGAQRRERLSELLDGELEYGGRIRRASEQLLSDPAARGRLWEGSGAGYDSRRFGFMAEYIERVRAAAEGAGNANEYPSPREAFLSDVYEMDEEQLDSLDRAERYVGVLTAEDVEDNSTLSNRIAESLGIADAVTTLAEREKLGYDLVDPYRRAARSGLVGSLGEEAALRLEELLELGHAGVDIHDRDGELFAGSDLGTAFNAIQSGRAGESADELVHEDGARARAVQEIAYGYAGWLDGGKGRFADERGSDLSEAMRIAAALDGDGPWLIGDYVLGSGHSGGVDEVLDFERQAVETLVASGILVVERRLGLQHAETQEAFEAASSEQVLLEGLADSADRYESDVFASRSFNDTAYLPEDWTGWEIATSGLDSAGSKGDFVLAASPRSTNWQGQERVARRNNYARASRRISQMYADSRQILNTSREHAQDGEAPGAGFQEYFSDLEEFSLLDRAVDSIADSDIRRSVRRATEIEADSRAETLARIRSRATRIEREIAVVGRGIRSARNNAGAELTAAIEPLERAIESTEEEIVELDSELSDAIDAFEHSNEAYQAASDLLAERNEGVEQAQAELRRAEAVFEYASSGYIGSDGGGSMEAELGEETGPVDPIDRLETARNRSENATAATNALESLHEHGVEDPRTIDMETHPQYTGYQDAFESYRRGYSDRLSVEALQALFSEALSQQEQIVAERFDEANTILSAEIAPLVNGIDSEWSEFLSFEPGRGGAFPSFSVRLDPSGNSDLEQYVEPGRTGPRAADDPDRSDFEQDRHEWLLGVADLIDLRGGSILNDWGLAMYHRDRRLHSVLSDSFRDKDANTWRATHPRFAEQEHGLEKYIWSEYGSALQSHLGLSGYEDIVGRWSELSALKGVLDTAARRPRDMLSAGVADFLEGSGLLRREIEYATFIREESEDAYERVMGDTHSRRLFDYYAGMHRLGSARGNTAEGILRDTGEAEMYRYILRRLSSERRRHRNAASRDRRRARQATVAGIATLPWPPASAFFRSAALLYVTAAGHSDNARRVTEIRSDANRNSRATRTRASGARIQLEAAAGDYRSAYAELVRQRERLAELRGHDEDREGGMGLSEFAESLDLAAEATGENLDEYLGDPRFEDVNVGVHELFGAYDATLDDNERGSTASFIASTHVEVSRRVSHARTAVETEALELHDANNASAAAYREQAVEWLDIAQSEGHRSELTERINAAYGETLFSRREHRRAMLALRNDSFERFDTLASPRLAEFDHRRTRALAEDLTQLVDGRFESYTEHRENEFDSYRRDLSTRRGEWESTMEAIGNRGLRGWNKSEREMNDSRDRWLDRTESAYEEKLGRWEGQYMSLPEKRAEWVERSAESAAEVGSAVALESIGASAEEAIAELESVHIGSLDTAGIDTDELVAEALGGFNFAGLLKRGRAVNASIARAKPNLLTTLGADRFTEGEVLHRIRAARTADSAEIERAVSLVSAERARERFVQIAEKMRRRVRQANESVEANVDRTYTGAGWMISGSSYQRDTLVGDTVLNGAIREHHRVRRYRHFDDYSFDVETDLSSTTLSRMSGRGIEAQLDAAVAELEGELESVFGESDAEAKTVAEAGENAKIDIERGWFARTFDVGEGDHTVLRNADAVEQPGLFGEHVGYAPQLRPDIDFDRSWRRSVLFRGSGQMHRLMGEFSYFQAMQAAGFSELAEGLHNTPLWQGEYAPTIRQVADVGVGVAGAFMSGGASLALSVGNAAAWGALDMASGDGTAEQALLGTMQAGAAAGVNHVSGFAANAVGGTIGAETMLGSMAGNLTAAAVSNAGSGAVHAVQIDDVRGLGFSTESFLDASLGDRALAGYGGEAVGALAGGTVEGFSRVHRGDVRAVGGAVGSGARAGLEYGMTGETVVNVANLRDIGALAGRDWNSAGLAEVHLGEGGAEITLGRGGIDTSAFRMSDIAGGMGTFFEQQRMRGYDLFGAADVAEAHTGTSHAATALRTLYSYGDKKGDGLRDDLLRGNALLRVGYKDDFHEEDLHKAFASAVGDGRLTVNMRTLGDRGADNLSGRLVAGLTMQHEALRDGYRVGERRSDSTVVTSSENVAETQASVLSRMRMADRMIVDGYERQLLSDDFIRSEYSLYEAARQVGQLDVFNRYARVGYGAEQDDFFARVSSEGMYQNDWSMREVLTVALLDGPDQQEIDEYNEAHRRTLYEGYLNEKGEDPLEYREFSEMLIEEHENGISRYDYQPQQKIDVWTYGCALYSIGYMVNKATGQTRNPIELNEAMRDNGYYSRNSRGQGTLLSIENIVSALNSFTGDDIEFDHIESIYDPQYTELSRTHHDESEYFGYLRIAHPDEEMRDVYPNGVHSEVINEIETVTGPETSRDVLSGYVSTANPWDGRRAAPGSYSEYIGRSRRAFDEIQRMDLIQVNRVEPEEPYWSQLGLDSWW
ncbi:MAG: hypothetical protein ACLFM0_00645 [Spirochaetales bacterium]